MVGLGADGKTAAVVVFVTVEPEAVTAEPFFGEVFGGEFGAGKFGEAR